MLSFERGTTQERHFVAPELAILANLAVGTTATETGALAAKWVRLLWINNATASTDVHVKVGSTTASCATTDTILRRLVPETFQIPDGSHVQAICACTATTGALGVLSISGGY